MSYAKSKRKDALVLSERDEDILKAVHFFRYVTALDVAHLLFSPSYISYVRTRLAGLCGGADFQNNQYLYRFKFPSASLGNSQRVYTLGSRGRDYILRELGLPVDWYFRPRKMTHVGYSHLLHSLILTRFLVAAAVWSEKQSQLKLTQTRISYDLAKVAPAVTIRQGGERQPLKVIPDAWLKFEHAQTGKRFPILLEIDRGTEYQRKFKQHIASRLEFVESKAYQNLFEIEAVVIAYATTGVTSALRETRRTTMSRWANEVLKELNMQEWSSIFRFHSPAFDEIYNAHLFEEPVWYRPDAPEPMTLFTLEH